MRAADRRIARMRLAAQRISSSDLESPLAVVRWMTALQAQDFNAAKWAIGLRSPGSSAHSVAEAFASGEMVRSWPMRGTLHIVAAEDLGWMLELTSARQVRGSETRRKGLGLSDRDLELARATAIDGLTGGLSMTRDQLYELFEREGIATTGQRGYRDRRPQLAAHDSQAVTPGNNGVFFPTMVSDGDVVGIWKRSTSPSREHNMAPFRDLSARSTRGFARAGTEHSRFVANP